MQHKIGNRALCIIAAAAIMVSAGVGLASAAYAPRDKACDQSTPSSIKGKSGTQNKWCGGSSSSGSSSTGSSSTTDTGTTDTGTTDTGTTDTGTTDTGTTDTGASTFD